MSGGSEREKRKKATGRRDLQASCVSQLEYMWTHTYTSARKQALYQYPIAV